MHKVLLAVRLVQKGLVLNIFSHEIALPFAPFPGLRFEQGTSCKLWETMANTELDPPVEKIIYDLDEDRLVCLFTINTPLKASFWYDDTPSTPGQISGLIKYFRHSPLP